VLSPSGPLSLENTRAGIFEFKVTANLSDSARKGTILKENGYLHKRERATGNPAALLKEEFYEKISKM